MNLRQCLTALALAVLVVACGGENKQAGSSCSLDAPDDCESSICVEATCASDDSVVSVCASEKCDDQAGCSSDETCVMGDGVGACVPDSACGAGAS